MPRRHINASAREQQTFNGVNWAGLLRELRAAWLAWLRGEYDNTEVAGLVGQLRAQEAEDIAARGLGVAKSWQNGCGYTG